MTGSEAEEEEVPKAVSSASDVRRMYLSKIGNLYESMVIGKLVIE